MIMKRDEFINKIKDIANKYNTVYMWGVFGAPVTDILIDTKAKQYPNWYTPSRIALFKSLVGEKFYAFDCVNTIKAILWGWNGDSTKTYGGSVYPRVTDVQSGKVIPDTSADGLICMCTGVSTNFSNIVPGEAVWMEGHIGVYIGEGKVVECTPTWQNKVQITALGNVRPSPTGLHSRVWNKHGKIPWIDYTATKKKNWVQIVNEISSSPANWVKTITDLIDATNADLGKLKMFHYFGTLIEKIYETEYIGKLNWVQIIDRVSRDSVDWKIAINAAVGAAKANGDLGVLESLKYLPDLIVKIYEAK